MATVDRGNDWVTRIADDLVRRHGDNPAPIVVASGISPSGPIHLGNLREVLTAHFVYSELQDRGVPSTHVLSWDNYDRYRRVPAGVPGVDVDVWSNYVGMPLSAVPAPAGSEHSSWAEHFQAQLRESLTVLGVEVTEIDQTSRYTTGVYADRVVEAMRQRRDIANILLSYQTGETRLDPDNYYPYRPFCANCGTDYTTVTGYDDETTMLHYACRCGFRESVDLTTTFSGKLVWKVDWAMRWAYESVAFEAAGADHMSPGSSWDAGDRIVALFGGVRPRGEAYSFVGVEGAAKISSSLGNSPTPADALQVMTPAMLRWLYARRRPNQAFTIDFGDAHQKFFDEWDSFSRKVREGRGKAGDVAAYHRSVWGCGGDVDAVVVPFRTLSSTIDVTDGNVPGVVRVLNESGYAVADYSEVSQRAALASAWLELYAPVERRTFVRESADTVFLAGLADQDAVMVRMLLEGLEGRWTMQGLTQLIFGVPKVFHGYDELEKDLPQQVRDDQQRFFRVLYNALVNADQGPRLPSLFLCIGEQRVRTLLGG